MAEVIEHREPVLVRERDEHVHMVDDRRSNVGTVVLVILAIIVIAILFMRLIPIGGGGGGGSTTNVTAPTPSVTTGK